MAVIRHFRHRFLAGLAPGRRKRLWFLRVVVFTFCFVTGLALSSASAVMTELVDMDLEELMSLKVMSVSKTPQLLSKIPAAVSIVTNSDIHRSGVTTLSDALRTVPGVEVAHIDGSISSVSIRGFEDRFSNKLLVLMDGRTVYTPIYSATHWTVQDTLFEDIDRIEVIRGPGGTIWGANAVNGVINVITKSSKYTQGGYAAGGYGNVEKGFGDLRYGGKIGDKAYYRAYTKYYNRSRSPNGEDNYAGDKAGFRTDWDMDSHNNLTVQGDYYGGLDYEGSSIRRYSLTAPFSTEENINSYPRGRNLLARFTHEISKKSDVVVQAYYDYYYLDNPFLTEARDTYDIDVKYRFPLEVLIPQEIIVGGGYRYTKDKTRGSFEVTFDPANRSTDTWTWSAQDELRLIEDFMTLTVGSKFEHNDYSGFEYQPSARLAIYPDSKNTFWGSVTRAVRTPSRGDHDVIVRTVVPNPLLPTAPVVATLTGNEDVESEKLVAYEAGVKSTAIDKLALDTAAFYNTYDDLRMVELGVPVFDGATLITVQPATPGNKATAETYGAEFSAKYSVTDDWRLTASYSYVHIGIHPESGPSLSAPESLEHESPNHQASIGTSIDLPWHIQFDTQLRYVGSRQALSISDYLVGDVRFAWKPRKDLELSITGRDLFDSEHFEGDSAGGYDFIGFKRAVRSSVYAKLEAKF